MGDMATFSFFANKTLNCGEGGAVLSSDKELMAQARLLKNHGMTKERPYWHDVVGDNFRLSNLHAAILLGQIERAGEIVEKKKRLSRLYREGLANMEGLAFRPCADWAEVVSWLEPLRVISGGPLNRDGLVQKLNVEGIQARPLWSPLAKLPAYAGYCRDRKIHTPIAERFLSELLWLPTSSVMTDDQIEKVVRAIRHAFGR
jgi:perosamine synthetase